MCKKILKRNNFFQYLLFQKKGKEGIQEEWVHCQDCSGQLQSVGDSPGNCGNFQTGVQVNLTWSCQLTGWYYYRYVHYWRRFWCWMRKMLVHVVWNIIALTFKWCLFSNEQIDKKLRFCLHNCPFLYSVIIFLKSRSFLVNEHYILS